MTKRSASLRPLSNLAGMVLAFKRDHPVKGRDEVRVQVRRLEPQAPAVEPFQVLGNVVGRQPVLLEDPVQRAMADQLLPRPGYGMQERLTDLRVLLVGSPPERRPRAGLLLANPTHLCAQMHSLEVHRHAVWA